MGKLFENGRALLIGIGEGYPGRLKLPTVVAADAQAVGRLLVDPTFCGFPVDNVQILLDAQATKSNILEGLHRLIRETKPEDTVFFFYSGHGGRRIIDANTTAFLCPVDYDTSDPQATGILSEELSALVDAIPAARVVVVLDSCHSEGSVFIKSDEDGKGLLHGISEDALDGLSAGNGRVAVSSCKEDEVSMTYSEKGHSLFTYFVLEGLRGGAVDRGDGLIRVLDLFHFVSEKVPENPRGGRRQHPVLRAHTDLNFPLALRKGGWLKGAEDAAPDASPTKPLVDMQRLESIMVQLYPSGPMHDQLWSRAGGDVSMLSSTGSGRAAWHSAIRILSLGGGGENISIRALIATAALDYPNSSDVKLLQG